MEFPILTTNDDGVPIRFFDPYILKEIAEMEENPDYLEFLGIEGGIKFEEMTILEKITFQLVFVEEMPCWTDIPGMVKREGDLEKRAEEVRLFIEKNNLM
jgi:hypothetical protein